MKPLVLVLMLLVVFAGVVVGGLVWRLDSRVGELEHNLAARTAPPIHETNAYAGEWWCSAVEIGGPCSRSQEECNRTRMSGTCERGRVAWCSVDEITIHTERDFSCYSSRDRCARSSKTCLGVE